MKQILLGLLLALPVLVKSQGSITMVDRPFNISLAKDTAILNPLKRNTAFTALSPLEQGVVYWLNVVRNNPQKFYNECVVPFVQQFPEAKGKEFNALKKDIKNLSSLPLFEPQVNLNKVAAVHAEDIVSGRSGFTHASRGKSFEQRMREAGINGCAAENLYEGKDEALVAVVLLLIDKDVSGYGHRKVILHPMLNTIGVSYLPSKSGLYILVQNFSCK